MDHSSVRWESIGSASALWLRLIAAGGSLVVLGSSAALAQASTPEATTAEVATTVHTSAEYLLTPEAAATVRPISATVSTPEVAAPAPQFSPAPAASDPASAPSRSTAPSMQVPAPPPGIVSQAPAPVPFMADTAAEAAEPAAEGDAIAIPSEIAADESVPPGYNSVFIDPTDYSVGATQAPGGPDIVFAERSSGCEITVQGGQLAQGCASTPTAAGAVTATSGLQVGPVRVNRRGVTIGQTTIVSREAINQRLRPLNVLRRGVEEYVFPLAIPAPITSLFGWRVHPIFGDHRFHSGTDLAAPTGTPVLATRSGRVSVSDYLGGYGLTVILRHDGDLESRYAHLSQILVEPGEWIEQGDVVGLVGSTGNSTGPHLHFEVRQLTAQGWVAMDPQEVLQYGIANLMKVVNNPLQALALGQTEAAEADALPASYPYRPAQPNAS